MPLPLPASRDAIEPQALAEINTTPLIDVMLVLLIMLIITIPLPLGSVGLGLPAPSAQAPPEPHETAVLALAADGRMDWNGQPLGGREDLRLRLQGLARQAAAAELRIRPDPRSAYRHTAAVLAAARREGLHRIAIVHGAP